MEQIDQDDRKAQLLSGMERLKERFVQTLPEHVSAFDDLWDCLAEPTQTAAAGSEISKLAHKLHGQAGSFGFPRIGALAAQVEKEAHVLMRAEGDIKTDLLEELMAALLDEIEDNVQAE